MTQTGTGTLVISHSQGSPYPGGLATPTGQVVVPHRHERSSDFQCRRIFIFYRKRRYVYQIISYHFTYEGLGTTNTGWTGIPVGLLLRSVTFNRQSMNREWFLIKPSCAIGLAQNVSIAFTTENLGRHRASILYSSINGSYYSVNLVDRSMCDPTPFPHLQYWYSGHVPKRKGVGTTGF